MDTPEPLIRVTTPKRPVKKARIIHDGNYTGNHIESKNLFGDYEEESKYKPLPQKK